MLGTILMGVAGVIVVTALGQTAGPKTYNDILSREEIQSQLNPRISNMNTIYPGEEVVNTSNLGSEIHLITSEQFIHDLVEGDHRRRYGQNENSDPLMDPYITMARLKKNSNAGNGVNVATHFSEGTTAAYTVQHHFDPREEAIHTSMFRDDNHDFEIDHY